MMAAWPSTTAPPGAAAPHGDDRAWRAVRPARMRAARADPGRGVRKVAQRRDAITTLISPTPGAWPCSLLWPSCLFPRFHDFVRSFGGLSLRNDSTVGGTDAGP